MNIRIRTGTEKDFPAILGLIKLLARYEKAEKKATNSVERMKRGNRGGGR